MNQSDNYILEGKIKIGEIQKTMGIINNAWGNIEDGKKENFIKRNSEQIIVSDKPRI